MSKKMLQSLLHLVLWSVAAIIFVFIFFSKDTISSWGDNTNKTIMLAVLFFFGFGGDFVLRLIFKNRKNKIIKDERDDYITMKSMGFSAIATFIYIFIVAISLYIKYEEAGSVPVAWVWYIAYSLVMVANITGSLASSIYYWKIEKA